MKLSKTEQELILKHRKKEDANKPKKIGYAKEDLYWRHDTYTKPNQWIFTLQEKEQEIKYFASQFECVVKAGAKFDCYIDSGSYRWYDRVFGIEGMDGNWAKKYLRDIQDIPKKK